MSKRVRFYAGGGLIVMALVYLMFNGIRNFASYYMTVAQFTANESVMVNKPARVSGMLVASSVSYNAGTGMLHFDIRDGQHVLPVEFHGVQPDSMTKGAHAIVDGSLLAKGVFKANKVMVQCPSHYAPPVQKT